MKYKDKIINNQNKAIENQINSMTAYGIDGFSITPIHKETIGNKDIEADIKSDKEILRD
ncbi:hypothetical protein [Candidatus Clostridium radicumherbarum]|uniref:Glycosyl hydrolase family 13 catalytic domain-containing protein n=1 Tax=Candidatus Clostridium radicumherbarum TaxID=3381662 RepID=A0ABW8TUZ1_9CLOT